MRLKLCVAYGFFQLKQLLELIEGEILPLIPTHSHFFYYSVHSAINVVCQMKLATQIFLLIVRKIASVVPAIYFTLPSLLQVFKNIW